MRHLYLIMGPAGCGKSSVAEALKAHTGWAMIEADDHHSASNVEKQSKGIALTDADRADWIDSMVAAVNGSAAPIMLLACSALTPYVQGRLRTELDVKCHWFLLDVSREELAQRLSGRQDHFMSPTLLDDQLDALSAPEDAIRINGERAIEQIRDEVLSLV